MKRLGLPTTTVDILRHAECEGGEIFRGSTDVALSAAGWTRLRRVTAPLTGWDQIITSPLQRCRQFAEELAQSRDVPLQVDARFREMDFGDWEGLPVARVWQEQQAAAVAWYADPESNNPPNAETIQQVRCRVAEGWQELVEQHEGGHVLLVAHGGVIRSLLNYLLAMDPQASNRFGMPYGCRAQVQVTHYGQASMPHLTGYNLDQAE